MSIQPWVRAAAVQPLLGQSRDVQPSPGEGRNCPAITPEPGDRTVHLSLGQELSIHPWVSTGEDRDVHPSLSQDRVVHPSMDQDRSGLRCPSIHPWVRSGQGCPFIPPWAVWPPQSSPCPLHTPSQHSQQRVKALQFINFISWRVYTVLTIASIKDQNTLEKMHHIKKIKNFELCTNFA